MPQKGCTRLAETSGGRDMNACSDLRFQGPLMTLMHEPLILSPGAGVRPPVRGPRFALVTAQPTKQLSVQLNHRSGSTSQGYFGSGMMLTSKKTASHELIERCSVSAATPPSVGFRTRFRISQEGFFNLHPCPHHTDPSLRGCTDVP